MNYLRREDPEIFKAVKDETIRQEETIELIASENFVSEAVLAAQGSVLTNKYAEGYPARRWYGGCKYIDVVEELAVSRAKKLFKAEHVNVQPHSGSQANMAVYFALLKPGDTVMALDLACGGHLTHGHTHNFSGMFYKIIPYGLSRKNEQIDYDEVLELAKTHRPQMILAGASAYPRALDFAKFRVICDEVGAYLFVDMAHIAGLVAAGLHQSPVPYADVVTTTNHKTLRGPRGGMVLCKQEFAKKIDSVMFPGIQGGPLMHVIAAKAVALKEALSPDFKKYQQQVVKNAKALSEALLGRGYRIVAGGTDTHLMLVDLTNKNVTGKEAAEALDLARITVNKNLIPFDSKSPFITSGIRLGTPAVTTRGMKEADMAVIAGFLDIILSNINDKRKASKVRRDVSKLIAKFPLYKNRIKEMKQ
jgi:glycine hydroxymethyltransferase